MEIRISVTKIVILACQNFNLPVRFSFELFIYNISCIQFSFPQKHKILISYYTNIVKTVILLLKILIFNKVP